MRIFNSSITIDNKRKIKHLVLAKIFTSSISFIHFFPYRPLLISIELLIRIHLSRLSSNLSVSFFIDFDKNLVSLQDFLQYSFNSSNLNTHLATNCRATFVFNKSECTEKLFSLVDNNYKITLGEISSLLILIFKKENLSFN